jgi:hypothetical protein
MRIGSTRAGSAKSRDTVWRPIHRTGRTSPVLVRTSSPIASVSTATSPEGVRIEVPAMKQITSALLL